MSAVHCLLQRDQKEFKEFACLNARGKLFRLLHHYNEKNFLVVGARKRNSEFASSEALLGVLGIKYIYPKYFSYKVLVNIDFWV